jgi:hypothetical protein
MEAEMGGTYSTRGINEDAYKILVGKPEERRQSFGDLGVDGRIILKYILKQLGVRV